MSTSLLRCTLIFFITVFASSLSNLAVAQKKYDPGASDTEIKIGNTMPYSGPTSAVSVMAKVHAAYFQKINDEGGINGRKIVYISYDDAYTPAKAIEQARKLVEGDEVLLIFSPIGTASNIAMQKYMNDKKVPQLFAASPAARLKDPKEFPWTMGWLPSFDSEGRIIAKYILKEKPDGKVGVLYQNDDSARDYLRGLKAGLGDKAASMIVREESYQPTDPTIDSHIINLKAAGVDVFVDVTTTKFAAQAIKKAADLGWKPLHLLGSPGGSIATSIKPAGFDISQGIISATFQKDPNDPKWKDDPGVNAWRAFLDKYYADADRNNDFVVQGYNYAQVMVQVLKQCGDDLTRENVMRQAANLKDVQLGMLLPGIKINTSPTDYAPLKQLQFMKLKGESWELFGEIINSNQ